MMTVLMQNNQIIIPNDTIAKLGLSMGDIFDVQVKDGLILLQPVSIYPQKYLDELQAEVDELKSNIQSGDVPVFDHIDAMFANLKDE